MLSDVLSFLWAVVSHWGLLATGGAVLGAMGLWERLRRPLPKKAYYIVLSAFVVVAFFSAWQDEHIKARDAEARAVRSEADLREAKAEKVLQVVQRPEPRIENIFNQSNWNELEFTKRGDGYFDVRLTLDHEPEESSLEVHKGPLWINPASMQIVGRTVTFVTVTDKFEYAGSDAIVVRYYPKR